MKQLLGRIAVALAGLGGIGLGIWISWRENAAAGVVLNLCVILLLVAFFRVPLARIRAGSQQLLWLFPLTTYFLVSIGMATVSDSKGTVAFFEVTAQVIPILVLALTVELRLFSQNATNVQGQAAAGLLTILFLGLGEFYCLGVVATGRPSSDAFEAAVSSLAAGFIGLIVGGLAVER
jgi:hypothetical protein